MYVCMPLVNGFALTFLYQDRHTTSVMSWPAMSWQGMAQHAIPWHDNKGIGNQYNTPIGPYLIPLY